jgi:SAM-dependent methyltransferase
MTNYSEASLTYDNTRFSDEKVVDLLARKFDFRSGVPFLDFGCGTGNYLADICARFGAEGYGTEPSDSMRRVAVTKNPDLELRKGDHTATGFPDGMFGLVYMTDVIHHVPDTLSLFRTMFASLRPGGLVAILTESHAQISSRWYNKYFPSLEKIERSRYPDIPEIQRAAKSAGFVPLSADVKKSSDDYAITDDFIRMVREKNYSMFRLLESEEYERGLSGLVKDAGKTVHAAGHGETLVWLKKER